MVVFSPVAQQPSSGIEDRLQAIQEILRCSNQQTVIAVDLRCDEGCNCRSRSLERQRFDAAFEKTKLAETATDSSSHVVFHRQIGLKHDAKVTSNSHRTNQGTADTELPGVKMGTRLLVAHQRNSVFSELRQSLLDRIHSAICSTSSSILRRCNPSDEGWPHVQCIELRVVGVEMR